MTSSLTKYYNYRIWYSSKWPWESWRGTCSPHKTDPVFASALVRLFGGLRTRWSLTSAMSDLPIVPNDDTAGSYRLTIQPSDSGYRAESCVYSVIVRPLCWCFDIGSFTVLGRLDLGAAPRSNIRVENEEFKGDRGCAIHGAHDKENRLPVLSSHRNIHNFPSQSTNSQHSSLLPSLSSPSFQDVLTTHHLTN